MFPSIKTLTERLHKKHIVAPKNFNRWLVPPASIAIHLCIGSVYAWSIFNPPLTKALGVVAAAAGDWHLPHVIWIFSVAIVSLGLSAAFAGKWLEEVGPRMVGVVAAFCWGGGFIIGGIGILTHQLWLVYLGYGAIGGCGLGLGYVSPVSTLIRWFPDRRGMATGMAIMGFGGGAMIGAPIIQALLDSFYLQPQYAGLTTDLSLITIEGVRYLEAASGALQEIVVVGARDAAQLTIDQGVYLVGTGDTGAANTFFVLGIIYFFVMMIAAFSYRIPAPNWKPQGWNPPSQEIASKKMMTHKNVHIDQALKTPQFYLLWIVLCFNVTAGIGVLGVAKTMMNDIFGSTLPHIVTISFAANYVVMISLFNMIGRFFWASFSDVIGRKTTYFIFFTLGIALYLTIPYSAQGVSTDPSAYWLILFYGATMIIFTMYGGGFATIPAYLADVFGTRYVGGIHGRLLTAWSTAGILGPVAISQLRESARIDAIGNLAATIKDHDFVQTFGASKDSLQELIATNTVTIQNLLDIAAAGTLDPSPNLYNSTMYAMAGLLAIALIANWMIKPVHAKHHMKD